MLTFGYAYVFEAIIFWVYTFSGGDQLKISTQLYISRRIWNNFNLINYLLVLCHWFSVNSTERNSTKDKDYACWVSVREVLGRSKTEMSLCIHAVNHKHFLLHVQKQILKWLLRTNIEQSWNSYSSFFQILFLIRWIAQRVFWQKRGLNPRYQDHFPTTVTITPQSQLFVESLN